MIMLRKKKIILGILVLMLCVAGYLNIVYDSDSNIDLENYVSTVTQIDEESQKSLGEAKFVNGNVMKENTYDTESVFAKCKLERDESRSENIDLLNNTINNVNASDDAKFQAEEMLIKISDTIEKEINIENIVRMKGFEDAMAFISDKNVTVTVKGEMLTEPQITQINDIVNEYIDTKNVKIVEVK